MIPHKYIFNSRKFGSWSDKEPYINDNKLLIPDQEPDPRGNNINNFPFHKVIEHSRKRIKNIHWGKENNNSIATGESLPYHDNIRKKKSREEIKRRQNNAPSHYYNKSVSDISSFKTDFSFIDKYTKGRTTGEIEGINIPLKII